MRGNGNKILAVIGIIMMIVNYVIGRDYTDAQIFAWSALIVNAIYEYIDNKKKSTLCFLIVAVIYVIVIIIDKFI